jgi:hypothetical protein
MGLPTLTLLLVCAGHTVGVSQGTVVVSHDGDNDDDDGVNVAVELVLARPDAARVGPEPARVRAGGVPCPVTTQADDVEDDGRAVRLDAHCPHDALRSGADVVVEVGGLQALPAEHRLLLKVIDDAGERATMLWSEANTVTLSVRHRQVVRWPTMVASLALLLTLWGARRPLGALLATATLSMAGVVITALLGPPGAPHDALVVVVTGGALLALLVSPPPRVRLVALPIGALLWWLVAPLVG